jgi:hypothetical protein
MIIDDKFLDAEADRIADMIEGATQVRWQSDDHRDGAIRNIKSGLIRVLAKAGVVKARPCKHGGVELDA